MRVRALLAFVVGSACAAVGPALGDEVIFKNGDRLTGRITASDGGKLTIKSDVAGEVKVDLKDVQTFSTDAPVQVRLKDDTLVREPVAASGAPATQPAPAGPAQVTLGEKTVAVDDIKRLNPKQAWTGAVLVNGSLARGNSDSTDFGLAANATLRRDDEFHDDRFSLGAAYNFGRQTVDGVQSTSQDNWFAQAKYDKFFSEKLYGYGVLRYDHDRLAFLDYRLAPGVGVGYQWVETADFNFSTEAGVSYIYEYYSNIGDDDKVALRLAYHVDGKLNEDVAVFHNLEWLPAFDDVGDFILNADAGIRAKLVDALFGEFKVQWQHDSTPAPGAERNDLRFLLGVGWQF
jgi:putative salt-induced outer membrane protein YdiY